MDTGRARGRPAPGTVNDFNTGYDEWLATQEGKPAKGKLVFDATLRRPSTGRDLAEYAHGEPWVWVLLS